MARTLLALALIVGLLVPAATADAARPLGLPPGKPLLYALQAESGTLAQVPGARGRLVLTLRGVPSQLLWFADRPTRASGSVRTRAFAGAWRRLGFRSDPPNAAIVVTAGRRDADALAVELGVPRYDARARTLKVRVRLLRSAESGLARLGRDLDRRLPARFGAAALFIDDASVGDVPSVQCSSVGELDAFPAEMRPGGYLAANGQQLAIMDYTVIYSMIQNRFGGSGNVFSTPDVSAPAGLQYQLCNNGIYPSLATSDYDSGGACPAGSIALHAEQFQPAGYVRADGRTLQPSRARTLFDVLGTAFGGDGVNTFAMPNLTAPPGLLWYVCANGVPWSSNDVYAGCAVGEVTLFGSGHVPPTYLPADGRVIPINGANVELYAALGTAFGGNGSSTFGLPNVPAAVPRTTYGICSSGLPPT